MSATSKPEEREAEFLSDLRELLARHDAEMTVTDDGRGCGMASPLCEVFLHGVWDQDGNVVHKPRWFLLPVYMRGGR